MNINLQNAALAVTAGKASQFPRRAIPQIALIGRSNVGKSSLINTLLGRKALARVSSAPGKTITVNFYDVDGKLLCEASARRKGGMVGADRRLFHEESEYRPAPPCGAAG